MSRTAQSLPHAVLVAVITATLLAVAFLTLLGGSVATNAKAADRWPTPKVVADRWPTPKFVADRWPTPKFVADRWPTPKFVADRWPTPKFVA